MSSSAFAELRAQVHGFMSSHWVFGELCKPITIPREAIDPLTGDVNHYFGEVRELRASGSSGRASMIWFKKKDRGYELRLGPAVMNVGASHRRMMPALRDIFVGEVDRGFGLAARHGRAKYIAWHAHAGPIFVLASFLAPGRAPIDADRLRDALQIPTNDHGLGRDDFWLIARLALYPGGVEEVIEQESKPSSARDLRVTDDSPLRFAYQLAYHFNDMTLHAALVAAAQQANIVTAPPRTKRARAAGSDVSTHADAMVTKRPTTHESRDTHESRPTTHESRPTTHESRPTTHESRPTTHESRAPVAAISWTIYALELCA